MRQVDYIGQIVGQVLVALKHSDDLMPYAPVLLLVTLNSFVLLNLNFVFTSNFDCFNNLFFYFST